MRFNIKQSDNLFFIISKRILTFRQDELIKFDSKLDLFRFKGVDGI